MKLESPVFAPHDMIPEKYTCKGDGINPPVRVTGAPDGTKSLALIVHDPDAPAGDWVHWIVWNLSPTTTDIGESFMPPEASQGMNSFNEVGYGGPCPPPGGPHRYVFDLYALDSQLTLNAGAKRGELVQALDGHVLSTAQLIGVFGG